MRPESCLVLSACFILTLPFVFRVVKKEIPMVIFRILILLVSFILGAILVLRKMNGSPLLQDVFDILLIIALLLSIIFSVSSAYVRHSQTIISFSLLIIILFTVPFFPSDEMGLSLPPILRNPFFYLHIPAYILAYTLLLAAFIASLHVFLVPEEYAVYEKNISLYMKISFWFMNAGMILGAIWAEKAWGNFWTWDIKENFSLAVILIQSLYFHQEGNRKTSFLIVTITTLLVAVNLMVINLIKSSLHAY